MWILTFQELQTFFTNSQFHRFHQNRCDLFTCYLIYFDLFLLNLTLLGEAMLNSIGTSYFWSSSEDSGQGKSVIKSNDTFLNIKAMWKLQETFVNRAHEGKAQWYYPDRRRAEMPHFCSCISELNLTTNAKKKQPATTKGDDFQCGGNRKLPFSYSSLSLTGSLRSKQWPCHIVPYVCF